MNKIKHTCFNCRLPILDGEEEIAVEGEELNRLKERCRRAGLRRNDITEAMTKRYRHKSYEVCGQREAAEVEWHYWNGPDSNGD
jgi:hypothetical protein